MSSIFILRMADHGSVQDAMNNEIVTFKMYSLQNFLILKLFIAFIAFTMPPLIYISLYPHKLF